MASVPVTQEGFDKLQKELKEFLAYRPEVLKAIQEAREKGDLKENAEYHAAREELASLEERIRTHQAKISMAAVVDKSKIGGDAIVFGATVKLEDLSDGMEEEFTLVGEGEADPLNNKILTTSPMGQALLTKKVGDTIEVPAPKGTIKFKVLEIRFE